MSDAPADKKISYIATDSVTALANRVPGLRHAMMRAAFRDGLLERRVHENAPALVEVGGALSFGVAVFLKAQDMIASQQFGAGHVLALSATAVALGGPALVAGRFRKTAKAEAGKIDRYMEHELQAVHTVLSMPPQRESSAHVLGRCMRYLCYYVQRNLHVVQFENGMMDAVSRRLSGTNEAAPDYRRPEGLGLGRLKEAKDVQTEDELLDDIIRGYRLLRECETKAFASDFIREDGKVGRYYNHCQRAPIEAQMQRLGLLKLFDATETPAKRPANGNEAPSAAAAAPA